MDAPRFQINQEVYRTIPKLYFKLEKGYQFKVKSFMFNPPLNHYYYQCHRALWHAESALMEVVSWE
jgi:hypothetical protein